MPAIEPDKQQNRSSQAMMMHKSAAGSKPVCILLSGAELSDLDLSSVELYMGSSSYDSTTRVELRRKSGLAAGTMANSFPWLSGSSSSSSRRCTVSSSFTSSCHYWSSLSNDAGPLPLFDSSWASADGWNSQRCLRILHSDETAQEHGLAPAPPIVLKSKGVLEMEKLEMVAATASAAGKPAAAATAGGRKNSTETAAPITAAAFSHRRPPKTSQPLPLPLPPPSPASSKHRRHTSIDLRSSPAAKFLVQLMPWEVPSPPPLRGNHDARTLSSPAPHCFVPFKWEEAPGRPKQQPALSFAANSTVHPARLLRLPPRLLVQQDGHRKTTGRESSPTSILDPESGSCSSSSPPQLVPKPGSSSRLKALWSWSIMDLVLGKKQQQPKDSDPDFDPFQGCGRRRRVRVVSMKKQRGGGGRRARNHGNHSMVDSKITASSTPGSSYVFPSPAAAFTWFDSPIHHRYVRKRRWASRKIAATCRALKRMAMGGRQPPKSRTAATMYRPLLCRVGADSAAFACSSSSL